MKLKFESSFARDLKRIKDARLRKRVAVLIERLEEAADLSEIEGIKKLKDTRDAFRLRMGDYRLGLLLRDEEVVLVRLLDRKDIYRHFP